MRWGKVVSAIMMVKHRCFIVKLSVIKRNAIHGMGDPSNAAVSGQAELMENHSASERGASVSKLSCSRASSINCLPRP